MNFINKLEKKFGRFAITNLSAWLIGAYCIGYLMLYLTPQLLYYMTLEPYYILHGQIWRIFTWIVTPPDTSNILFIIIMMAFYYSIGTSLERTWGTFRYNLYIFSGITATVIGSLLLYAALGQPVYLGNTFSTYYINLSIFLAFAASYPEMQVLLYFVIPLKIKWLAYLDIIVLLYSFVKSDWVGRVAIIVSLLNFIVFFFGTRNYKRVSPKEIHRKAVYKKQVTRPLNQGVTKHKCAICGRTEKDGEDLEFRFCSKCNGNYEYCQEHLFTHQHVK